MIKFVNAKINIGLYVVKRRPDGYHDLSTLFYPVGLHAATPSDPGTLADVVEVIPASADTLTLEGGSLDCSPEQNLVFKALKAFRSLVPSTPPVHIYLSKHIPSQAGLGGGSADASFTLMALNELTGFPLSEDRLLTLAASLGADCPFFILNRPAFASGIGDILTPADISLSGKWVAILKPDLSVSTRQAFSCITPCEPAFPLAEALHRPIEEWSRLISNDFERSMFTIHPSLRSLKDYLYSCGALYASMSGSGSAFYGIFPSECEALGAASRADTPFATVARL